MAAPTAEELLLRFRREVDDRFSDPDDTSDDSDRLWANDEIYAYMNEAQYETARATRGLLRVLTVPIVDGANLIPLTNVLQVMQAELPNGRRLEEVNDNEHVQPSDDYGNITLNWNHKSVGTPRYYTLDAVAGKMRLSPIPNEDSTLTITVIALPRSEIESGSDDVAFSDPKDLRLLLHYMKYLAYDKQDADVYDGQLSESFRAKFDLDSQAREQEIDRLRTHPRAVRYSG